MRSGTGKLAEQFKRTLRFSIGIDERSGKEKVKDRQKEKVKLFRPPNLTYQIFEYSPNVAEMI